MRILVKALALLSLVSLAAPAQADIIAVRFKTQKIANRYKDHLIERGGELLVIGEKFDDPSGGGGGVPGMGAAGGGKAPYNVIVADPADPLNVSYKIEIDKEGNEKIVRNRKKVVTIPADDTVGAVVIVKNGTLATFAGDYADRKREIDELIAARDAEAKGSAKWMAAHQQTVMTMERLESWLRSTLYPAAADKLAKEIAKQRKLATADATRERKATALASLKTAECPPALVETAKAISGGTDVFKVQESLHCRIIYRETIDDERIKGLLTLAEEIIDGFRVEFVDPYLEPAYEDYIPEYVFGEWFFNYDDDQKHERYWVEYFKQSWGDRKEEKIKSQGHGIQRSLSPEFTYYWRTDDNANLEGMVAHNLGHMLAGIHFDKRRIGGPQDWIEEGMGLFLSMEWLGGNSVTCKQFSEPVAEGRTASKKAEARKEGEKTVQFGLRDYFNALALEKGPKLDKLAMKKLAEFEDADLAKCWSLIDYIAKKSNKEGQLFLRAACNTARTPATFIAEWRKKAEEIFGVKGQDVFALVENQWKAYAEAGQDTGDTRKK